MIPEPNTSAAPISESRVIHLIPRDSAIPWAANRCVCGHYGTFHRDNGICMERGCSCQSFAPPIPVTQPRPQPQVVASMFRPDVAVGTAIGFFAGLMVACACFLS